MRIFYAIGLLVMCAALGACAGDFQSGRPGSAGDYYPRKVESLEETLKAIGERNNSIEKHPDWISLAGNDFMLKSLDDLAESEYGKYAEYLDDGVLYVVVHPAYSVFFNDRPPPMTAENPVDAFLNEAAFTKHKRFLQEQERSVRDFLEITSTRKRLVLVVLPGGYREYNGYVYKDLNDEYARYINSVTNSSESALYLYSKKPNRGYVGEESKKRLSGFIEAVGPRIILIGGGYLGRCVEDFYKDISASAGKDKVTIAAEITSISAEDIRNLALDDFLKDGRLNVAMLKEVISSRDMKGGSLGDFLRNYRNYRVQKKGD